MKNNAHKLGRKLRTAITVAATFALMAQAKAASTGMPWESGLEKIKASVSGPVAGIISLFCIIGAGLGLAFGGDNMSGFLKKLVYVVLVIALIMGANSLLNLLWGSQGAMIGAIAG